MAHRAAGLVMALFGMLAIFSDASAHPHAWIDVETALRFDDARRVDAVSLSWTFDPVYSAILLEEMRHLTPGGEDSERLQALGDQMMKNIGNFGYLTHFSQGSDTFSGGTAEAVELSVGERGRLRLRFELLLEQPRPIHEQPLTYRVYDPVYYIDMSHGSADAVDVRDAGRPCRVAVAASEPDAAQIARASEVDAGSSEAEGLGRHFAERVSILCPEGSD